MRRPLVLLLAVTGSLALVASGCSSDEDGAATTTTAAAAGSDLSGSITVSAAASLTESFTTIQQDFTAEHPDADVVLNFGSSGALSTQIVEGAPAAVAAFADTAPMTALADADLLDGEPEVFARNQLVIVTTPGNPEGIESLIDLSDVGVVSLCVDTAPCGRFADQILAGADVSIPVGNVTRGTDVRSTLTAVSEGDAVAAIVYVTDAAAAGDAVDTVEIPAEQNVVADYPIAVVAGSEDTELARAFMTYVLSDEGQAVLADAGFLSP
jgi:molybdate transport system substrate-binding protein